MAKLPHLPLERLEKTLDRRRVPAPAAPPVRESAGAHAASITAQIDAVTKDQQALPKIEGIDPELVLKVRLSAPIQGGYLAHRRVQGARSGARRHSCIVQR
jgi:hypothetical protein